MADLDVGSDDLDQQLKGLDHLELSLPSRPSAASRIWRATWPVVAAIVIGVVIWQLVVWVGWKPKYLLPGPVTAFKAWWDSRHDILPGVATTLSRAIEFYLIALVAGTLLAVGITRSQTLRTAVSPLLSGLQTMPSVVWVPFAILIFGVGTVHPILFVALIGTIPCLTIGTISAIDAVPPSLLRAGRILGTRGVGHYRHVVLPAALPGYVAGMKQGWAFLWRSLMAGELIAQVPGKHALGQLLSAYQDQQLAPELVATMLTILVLGLLMDTLVFSRLERFVLTRRGLSPTRI